MSSGEISKTKLSSVARKVQVLALFLTSIEFTGTCITRLDFQGILDKGITTWSWHSFCRCQWTQDLKKKRFQYFLGTIPVLLGNRLAWILLRAGSDSLENVIFMCLFENARCFSAAHEWLQFTQELREQRTWLADVFVNYLWIYSMRRMKWVMRINSNSEPAAYIQQCKSCLFSPAENCMFHVVYKILSGSYVDNRDATLCDVYAKQLL